MKIQQIRNATLKLTYAGKILLTDPYLAEQHSMVSYRGDQWSPLVELPFSIIDVLDGVEMILVSHIHSDHFDKTAQKNLSKSLPLYCQPVDASEIEKIGFYHVVPVHDSVCWEGITITRTEGRHGSGDVLKAMGEVSGYVLQAENEPTVYWAGDTVLYDAVYNVISEFKPDIILTHSCGAIWGDNVPIIMNAKQTVSLCKTAPKAIVIATHMGTVDHGTVTREDLRAFAEKEGIPLRQLQIPEDGEILNL
ncbi:MAG: MBL fold metallo-hydrolase [Desulfobacula sp.]|jgi:L-ascorbate metabolism protein UlaG (beta-lactamase superfamily)|uniref:MBL fold metallo-hydrolase n=1 Tax=Desulfobacula sp. TaxID=2593537 RepID=UPI001D2C4CD9|nr:MBL fold metallo-hydrolase [Desulfobacula sp.]MBT3804486.1 MBL fold metallo-hydrolase [Desulfobacula sp.]MBT4024920.1 MBL fold metallo-hydrolase [Desulfobacula sp.]MBT4198848.1 MBL fold metallo-hydrolase [Desulfobacula sp.]MBT4508064.1 MBL fold metallo-hydrolase [Desulfobacula sp.]